LLQRRCNVFVVGCFCHARRNGCMMVGVEILSSPTAFRGFSAPGTGPWIHGPAENTGTVKKLKTVKSVKTAKTLKAVNVIQPRIGALPSSRPLSGIGIVWGWPPPRRVKH
jgi:hypothetical protein